MVSAYITYEIHGTVGRDKDVYILFKGQHTPTQEVMEYLLREKYPSARNVRLDIPAAKKYPLRSSGAIHVRSMESTAIRRTR